MQQGVSVVTCISLVYLHVYFTTALSPEVIKRKAVAQAIQQGDDNGQESCIN